MRSISTLIALLIIIPCTAEAYGRDDLPTDSPRRTGRTMSIVVDDVAFGTLPGCDRRDSVSSLANSGPDTVIVTGLDFQDPTNGYFSIRPPTLPDTLQPGESMQILVTFAPESAGAFQAKIIYHVTNLDRSLFIGYFTSNLTGTGETITAHAHISRDYRAFPGTVLDITVMLDDKLDMANITEILFSMRFNSDIIAVNNVLSERIESMMMGTLLAGWQVTVLTLNDTLIAIRLVAPAGRSLNGNGPLLNIKFVTFAGNGIVSELPFDIILPNRPCVTVVTSPGRAGLDSVAPLWLQPVAPNPIYDSFTVRFVLSDPASITLALIASDGSLIATPVDRQEYRPGIYEERFSTEGLAPGAYTLVMRAGAEERIERFVVLK